MQADGSPVSTFVILWKAYPARRYIFSCRIYHHLFNFTQHQLVGLDGILFLHFGNTCRYPQPD